MMQSRHTKAVSLLLLAIVSLFGVLGVIETSRTIAHQVQAEDGKSIPIPIKLGVDRTEIRIVLPPSVTIDLLAIDVESDLRVDFHVDDQALHGRCAQTSHASMKCHAAVERGRGEIVVVVRATGSEWPTIRAIAVRQVRQVHDSSLGTGDSLLALAIVVLMVPALWLLHRRRRFTEWMLVAAAIAGLLVLQAVFTIVLLFFLLGTFTYGKYLVRISSRQTPGRSRALAIGAALGACVLFLGIWKYAPNLSAGVFANPGGFALFFPLGLSYFVIRIIDTLFHWHRGEGAQMSVREYLCYVLFPATIPAGPIQSYGQFHDGRLEKITTQDVAYGLSRIVLGSAKKVIVVDNLLAGVLFEQGGLFHRVILFPQGASAHDLLLAPFCMLAFAYLDFSAYSDIAIGGGRMLGYRINENFNWPVVSRNLQEYWQRWHMSLSRWLMWNVYMPLTLALRVPVMALLITMLVAGLWHALNLSWFCWAIHHTVGLAILAVARRFSPPARRGATQWWGAPTLSRVVTLVYAASGFFFAFIADFGTAASAYALFWAKLFML